MPNDPTWLLTFIQAAVATLLLVGLGAAIGYCLGAQRAVRSAPVIAVAPRVADWAIDLEAYRVSGLSVADKIGALTQLTIACRQSLSPALLQAIDELADASRSLRQQVEKLAQTKATQGLPHISNDQTVHQPAMARLTVAAREHDCTAGPSSQSDLSKDEVRTLRANAGEPSSKSQDVGSGRYKYDCRQNIYPFRELDGAASIAPAISVRCRDIGTDTVTFFIGDCPDFCNLIAALGSDQNPVFMAAKVENSKVMSMYGEVGYLVACRFVARLPEFSEQSRVLFNKRRNWDIARYDEAVSAWSQSTTDQVAQVPVELLA